MNQSLAISRRVFLKLFATATAAGVLVPAMEINRKPYVTPGETVNWVGKGPSGMSFTGGKLVQEVLPWDGVGYPVKLHNGCYGKSAELEEYYDFDLANFNREIPDKFWWSESNRKKYNNVHTYLREQRFGETTAEAVSNLNFYQWEGA